MLFDWLVIGHVIDVNPAHAVRGPKYVVKKGKTPVLTAQEARELLDSISIVRNTARDGNAESEEPAVVGLRDRALIAVMVYSFARINAVLEMKVRDYCVQGRRGWVRLHEKGGKEHEVPCHHNLELYLDEYIAAAGIGGDKKGPLFRSFKKGDKLIGNPLIRSDVLYIFVERLWRSLKYEEVYLKAYQNVAEARRSIAAYFDFYNHQRLHQALDYRAPRQVFEEGDVIFELRRGRKKPPVPIAS
jgi:integrase